MFKVEACPEEWTRPSAGPASRPSWSTSSSAKARPVRPCAGCPRPAASASVSSPTISRDKDELIAFAFDWLAERSFAQLDRFSAVPSQAGLDSRPRSSSWCRWRKSAAFRRSGSVSGAAPCTTPGSPPCIGATTPAGAGSWRSAWQRQQRRGEIAVAHPRRRHDRPAGRGGRRALARGDVRRCALQRAAPAAAGCAADGGAGQPGRFCRSSARTRPYSCSKAAVNERGSSSPPVCWVSSRKNSE